MIVRKAKISDVKQIQEIVNHFASSAIMLSLSLSKIYDNIRDFMVIEVDGEVVATGALHIVWDNLAEVRSTAVKEGYHKKGYASVLVKALEDEARQLGLKEIFLLTYQDKFFTKMGFDEIEKQSLPHKVWTDCINCAKFPDCDEIAMKMKL